MNLTFSIHSKLFIVLIIIVGLSLSGCESDPILSPQVETEEEGGSYGNTNLPLNQNQNSGNANKDIHTNKADSNMPNKTNPTLF